MFPMLRHSELRETNYAICSYLYDALALVRLSKHFFRENTAGEAHFFKKHSTNVDTHTRTSTHPYKHTHVHLTLMSTSKRLSRLDLEIHEVGHQERLAVDGDIASH
jgi:hypothetical protein